jgi:hypothetical protein
MHTSLAAALFQDKRGIDFPIPSTRIKDQLGQITPLFRNSGFSGFLRFFSD